MLPKTKAGEREHRKHKREMEIGIITEELSSILKSSSDYKNKNIDILEFGSGDGFQIPYLKRIGNVVASDIYTSNGIKSLQHIEFVECGINHTPFNNGQFDIIFSNHVIEHIDDITNALRETQRIGKSSCIYAFSVPTNIWLLLSIPAQYYNKLKRVTSKLSSSPVNSSKINKVKANRCPNKSHKTDSKFTEYIRFIMPKSHGVSSNFIECYRDFRIKRWQRLFSDNAFSIIKIKPLLLYGPSEWPIIPTLSCKTNLCSSVLFLMKKEL